MIPAYKLPKPVDELNSIAEFESWKCMYEKAIEERLINRKHDETKWHFAADSNAYSALAKKEIAKFLRDHGYGIEWCHLPALWIDCGKVGHDDYESIAAVYREAQQGFIITILPMRSQR